MAKDILKVTEGHCVVKVSGAASTTETIALKTDLLKYNDPNTENLTRFPVEVAGSTVNVNVTGFTWSGDAATVITITRGGTKIATLLSAKPSQFNFFDHNMVPDSVKNTDDIVVAITSGQGELWIAMQKMKGFTSTIEPSLFGQYDDKTKVGE
jgi:hypothetical protein